MRAVGPESWGRATVQKVAIPLAAVVLAVVLMGAQAGGSTVSGGVAPALAADSAETAPPTSPSPDGTLAVNGVVNVGGVVEGTAGTPTPTETPYESIAGATGTPPPTSSKGGLAGVAGSSSFSVFLISLLFAGVVWVFVERKRRSVAAEQTGKRPTRT